MEYKGCLNSMLFFSWVTRASVHPCPFSTVSLRSLFGLRPPSKIPSFAHYAYHISLPSVQYKSSEGVLSLCGCSLTLTLTTSIGIWHSADATKSWFLVLQLSCFVESLRCMVNCPSILSVPLSALWFLVTVDASFKKWTIPPQNDNLLLRFGALHEIIIFY